MSVQTASAGRTLPGHMVINLILALCIWTIGVYFTRQVLPIDVPVVPWLAAVGFQILLTVAQMNIRVFGISTDGWPFVILVVVDVGLNAAGLLVSYVEGVANIPDAGLYLIRAVTTGAGAWQCGASLLIGALIAFTPEQMVRSALKRT